MSDATLRALERAVLSGGDEAARVALDVERRRRGMGSLWGYAPRICRVPGATGEGERGLHVPHLPGTWFTQACTACDVARREARDYVRRYDAVTDGKPDGWRFWARVEVALVRRVAAGASTREIRRMLSDACGLSGWRLTSHGRKMWGSEVGRAFPALSRKPKPVPVETPLFGEAVPHGQA